MLGQSKVEYFDQVHNQSPVRTRIWATSPHSWRTNHQVVVAKLTRILFSISQSSKGQSLRIRRNQDDDSDGPVYSDVDDAPTPPPHRRALGPSASLPAWRTEHDFYGTNETGITVLLKINYLTINSGNFIQDSLRRRSWKLVYIVFLG